MAKSDTLSAQFFAAAKRHPRRVFLREKVGGVWQGLTYGEAREAVLRGAHFLAAQGVEKGDRVFISAPNCTAWAIADLAIMSLGALVVPSYTTSTFDEHCHVLKDSGAVLALTSSGKFGGQLAEVVARAAEAVPTCRGLVLFDDAVLDVELKRLKPLYWQAGLDTAEATEPNTNIASTDLACLIYTSGTGGAPKGVMLTHHAICHNVESVGAMLGASITARPQRFLSLLPLAHAYEHTGGLHLPIFLGAEIWYCEGVESIASNLLEAKPTLMIAVPRLYEVLHERIERGIEAKGGISAKFFRQAVQLGMQRLDGVGLSWREWLWDRVLEILVRRKLRRRLGGRLSYFCSGGAPLNPDIGRFFLSLGVGILQGYGQTEAAPVISLNPPDAIRIASVGHILPNLQAKIADDGEVLVRGDSVMAGYWNNPLATAEVLKGGWLHTGDIGALDGAGYLSITGRKKEIIINSGGDNIAPARIEAMLSAHPDIAQVILVGDRRPFLGAVVVVADDLRTASKTTQGAHIKAVLNAINADLSTPEKIRRFVIADAPFSVENGEMTPTLKLRRHIIAAHYAKAIDALYK